LLFSYRSLFLLATDAGVARTPVVYAFGDCRLDIPRRELQRDGALIDLAPQVFDLLAYLVRHRARVVSKDDLIEAVWNGRIVSDSALTTRINAVRRALGDDGAAQRLVRTVARRGVRFVGEVTEVAEGMAPEAAAAAPGPVARAAPPLPEKPSLMVLPFANLSADPDQEYFVDGMVEEITTAIARLPSFLVISRNSAFAYKGKTVDVRQVARELGVRYVLEGSVRKSGNRVRILGQLIDATTAAHIWADRFDGALDDIFELQDRVAIGVVRAIAPRLHSAEIERAVRKPTESLDAYDLYLRALAENNKRTKEGMDASVRFARQALELDPGYAPAMARLALSLSMQRLRGWILSSDPKVEDGIRMARQAIAAAGDDQWALAFAGLGLANLGQDFDAALAAIDRAIALNPNFAHAIACRALVLSYRHDRADEAVASAERALSLSPFDQGTLFTAAMATAIAHIAAGRYEAGLPWAMQAKRANGGLPAFRMALSILGHLGRHREAAECLRELREIMPEPTVARLAQDLVLSPEIVARLAEGWRKAGVPED
jgi:TolB-like protein